MFERFTSSARSAVIGAQEHARARRDTWIGNEHLLLALAGAEPGDPARDTLDEFGLTLPAIEHELASIAVPQEWDAEALGSVGIDLAAVRERVEAQFGAGALDEPAARPARRRRRWPGGDHIPFTDDAKATLELALREAIDLQDRHIGSGHLLLGLVRLGSGRGFRVIERRGVDIGLLRTRLAQRMRSTA